MSADCLRATTSTAPCHCDDCERFVRYWASLTGMSEAQR